ncbi:hypothetical protein [Micromonospora sp. CP22]|uniref:hypothetical protein n=1 Tax=Micromonospora sp. CP22 TaxID=2580517 RepID=UPI001E62551F
MVAVALRFGERPEVAYVLPLSVDGMLVVASAAMVDVGGCDRDEGGAAGWGRRRSGHEPGVGAAPAANLTTQAGDGTRGADSRRCSPAARRASAGQPGGVGSGRRRVRTSCPTPCGGEA